MADQRYEKVLRDTAAELELNRQASESVCARLRGEHERELRQLQDNLSELEDKNSRLMKELYSDQNEIRLLRQELEAVKMLKEIEIAQLKSIYSRSAVLDGPSVESVAAKTPRTQQPQPTKLYQALLSASGRASDQCEP